ncbi:hypothetical protein ACHWQZ_G005106 [Mnemiopsis leidyi]
MDGTRFLQYISWLNCEIIEAKIKKPVVVIMDGFSGHISLSVLEEARKNEIILVKLPPNSTHYLQALDVAVFGPMKKIWGNITRKFYCQSQNKSITKSVFPVLLSSLMERMHEEGTTNLVSGFRATGVWPLDKEHVLKRLEKKHGINSDRNIKTEEEKPPTSNSKPSLIEVEHDQVTETKEEKPSSSESKPNLIAVRHQDKDIKVEEENPSSMKPKPRIIEVGHQVKDTAGLSSENESVPDSNITPQRTPIRITNSKTSKPALCLTPTTSAIRSAVQQILRPEMDNVTKMGIANLKYTMKLKRKFGEIMTSEDAYKMVKEKEEEKEKKKKEQEEKKRLKQAKSQKQAAGKTYNRKRKAESVNKPDTDSDAKIAESLPKGKQSKRVKFEQNPVAVVKTKKGKRNVLPVQESDSDANIAEMLPKGKQSKRVKVEQHPVTVKKTTNGKRKALSVQESDSESETEFLKMLSKRKKRIIDSIYSDENDDEDIMTPNLAVHEIIPEEQSSPTVGTFVLARFTGISKGKNMELRYVCCITDVLDEDNYEVVGYRSYRSDNHGEIFIEKKADKSIVQGSDIVRLLPVPIVQELMRQLVYNFNCEIDINEKV